jgi:hypothetical protein
LDFDGRLYSFLLLVFNLAAVEVLVEDVLVTAINGEYLLVEVADTGIFLPY